MNLQPLPVENLKSIGITDLDNTASLLTRKDRKYLVPMSLARLLIAQGELRVLEIDGRRAFRYESVYFDTPDRVSYLAAAHMRRRRFKVRTRSYLDSGMCSLEVKTRERRGLTEKHRLSYEVDRRTELTGKGLEFVDGFDTIAPVSRELQPVLTTRYERTTLLEPESQSRITIDTNLQCEAADGSSVALPGMAIVETKTSGQPCAIDHFLWKSHRRPTKISKYCTGLAALTPGLPANKWNRVLRTHFGWKPKPPSTDAEWGEPDVAFARRPSPRITPDRRNLVPFLEGAGS